MNDIALHGCRNDTLLGYLKALGILRTFSMQADKAARASWNDATLILHTAHSRPQLEKFFIERYAPTPVANPWNNGAGFDGKEDAAAAVVGKIRVSESGRWIPYRRVMLEILDRYVATGRREAFLSAKDKEGFLRDLRQHCPEEGLAWLDAAVAIGAERVAYPFLLGSGGNDGRLDFSVNFAARALDVVGDEPLAEAGALLRDALDDTSSARLTQSAIGQFSPRHAGGANATSGFDADSLVNPWDYVFLIEGTIMFSGALVKRSGSARIAFPFAFRGAGGYGSASSAEESRGEVWLPVWTGRASLPALTDLFRKGRADLIGADASLVRTAAAASEAAAAALTVGMNMGLQKLERVAFVQRNGLAYAATAMGSVAASDYADPFISVISSPIAAWVEGMRKRDAAKGGNVADALRQFDGLLFRYVGEVERGSAKDKAQELVASLATLDFALASKAPEWPPPLRYLDAKLVDILDDGSPEHAIAAALASLGASERSRRFRLHLEHAKYVDGAKGSHLVYDRTIQPLLQPSIEKTLADIAVVRARRADDDETGEAWWWGTRGARISDIEAMLRFDPLRQDRLGMLIRAYAIVEPPSMLRYEGGTGGYAAADVLPAAYALMKIVLDHPEARDPRILNLLNTGQAERALSLATQRARTIRGLFGRWRDIGGISIENPRWYAAMLLIPIQRTIEQYGVLLRAAMAHAEYVDVRAYCDQLTIPRTVKE